MFKRFGVILDFKSGRRVELFTRAHSVQGAVSETLPLFDGAQDTLVSVSCKEEQQPAAKAVSVPPPPPSQAAPKKRGRPAKAQAEGVATDKE